MRVDACDSREHAREFELRKRKRLAAATLQVDAAPKQGLATGRVVSVLGISVAIASAEDVIIAKLEWAGMAESERQLSDVAGIIRMQTDSLDTAYIERWVASLQLQEQWIEAQSLALQPAPEL